MKADTSYGETDVSYNGTPDFSVEESVIEEIRKRSQVGFKKYGKTMTRTDLSVREWLQHALEEALDLSVYLKRVIMEMDGKIKP
jgi:hypothetical protein